MNSRFGLLSAAISRPMGEAFSAAVSCSMGKTAQQPLHLHDAPFLGGNDGLKNRHQLPADGVLQRIAGHADGSLVMRNHFTHKVAVYVVGGAGNAHLGEHGLHDAFRLAAVFQEFRCAVGHILAGTKNLLHIFDTLCLFGNNRLCDVLQRYTGRVLQQIL